MDESTVRYRNRSRGTVCVQQRCNVSLEPYFTGSSACGRNNFLAGGGYPGVVPDIVQRL